MKRLRVPGIMNIVEVSDLLEVQALAADVRIDRRFDLKTCPLNWLLLRRSLAVLSFEGKLFPTMIRRDCDQRRKDQAQLMKSLDERSDPIRSGPEELEPLARWIRGIGSESEVGILAQQLLGRLFVPGFIASKESWAAAEVLVAAPKSWKLWKMVWWFAVGKVRRSKRSLARMVGGDLSALNAVGIAVHNLVKGIRRMRTLYEDSESRSAKPDAIARQCLFAPSSLYRQATAAGRVGDLTFSRNTLFVLKIGEASRRDRTRRLVFMQDSWSCCPASEWVPAMLEGLWRRATSLSAPQ